MDLITTHINADFDALGSLVAAKKLYPDARLLLPGSLEEAVREFLSLARELIIVESERECKLDDVDRLILVDTRHKSRIGIAAGLVDKGVDIHIYDHHPRMKGDIIADKDLFEEVGATVTMLADIIKRKGIRLSPLEATIMLVGIYEETGSLTYRTTTKLDVDMVSFLLSQGAILSVVSKYLNRELSEGELSLLVKLISASRRVMVKGVNISLINIESASYAGELGMIIHRLMEIENIPAIFVFLNNTAKNRVDIIARSNIAAVDLNKILSHFGGGGHAGAAGARIHDSTAGAVKEKLIKILKSNIRLKLYAADIMSRDVNTLKISERVDEAREALLRERASGMPVIDRGNIVGVISLTGLNKAIKQGFGHSRIKGYMSNFVITAKHDTPLYVIQKMILDKDISVLPVTKGRKIIGVINRTDVLKGVYGSLFLKPQDVRKKVVFNLSKRMKAVLPKDVVRLMKRIGALANSRGYTAFVVGGLVRDLMLGARNLDLDIVTEGDAIKLGQELAGMLGASLVTHNKFGTCSIVTKYRMKVDLATARKEVYEKPAALPTVEFSSLKNDLVRRDFTINAMAASLNRGNFGQLIDFFGAEEDLARGRIKVMHDASFIDDPTRIFRAVRFEQRFGFAIEPRTEALIRSAIDKKMFDKVEPQRIRDEIVLLLKEADPIKSLERMAELDELRFLHPKIRFTKDLTRLYKSINNILRWYDGSTFKKRPVDKWLVYLMVLFEYLSYNEVVGICKRFVFRRGDTLRILSCKKRSRSIASALAAGKRCPPSRIYRILEPLSLEMILLIMARSGSRLARSRIADFLEKYNGIRILVRGEDLKKMGLEPCPDFRIIMEKILSAKIDGKLNTKKDELAYAKKLISSFVFRRS
ncbi:MAG: CBS domain-containing protein [Candidatus Omnitrophota bacterium]|nr:CBS domain-containing protein [Candidatus Omnitrophota bacterium]